jgi:hypothetical protein
VLSENTDMVGMLGREVMLGPDFVARAASAATSGRAEQWMLRQPRAVRRSYVYQVIDKGDGELEQRIWMLRQPEAVRNSYLREVVHVQGAGPEVAWMLSQADEVRESYINDVLRRR